MRAKTIVLTAIVLVVAVVVEGQRRVCQPGSVFRVSCNTCRCSSNGRDMACTRKECPPGYPGSRPWGSGNGRVCEPGSVFKMDCNDCRCNDDGTNAACTLKACPPF